MQIARELKVECGLKEDLEEIYNRISMGEKKDYAASRGEYLNGRILAAYLWLGFCGRSGCDTVYGYGHI